MNSPIITKEVYYGLYHKESKRIVGYHTSDNSGGYACVDASYILDHNESNEWLVKKFVRNNSTEWYNADYNTPTHNYNLDEIEVIKVEKEVTITTENVELPDSKTLFTDRYSKTEPKHLEYLLNEINKGENIKYDIYHLNDYLRKNKVVDKSILE